MLRPLAPARWNFTTAAHLLNRAGFGGPPSEIEKLAALGPEEAIASLVDYERIPDPTEDPPWAKPDPERVNKLMALRQANEQERRKLFQEMLQAQRREMIQLRYWWLQRMAHGPRPLQEKMVLFWHGHFATSVQKVRDAYLMWRQNDLFRRHAVGAWPALLFEVSTDPAMLVWLDQARSRREHPNENFAREVMELFTLGEGHYSEKDVTEAARAFTGWSYDRLNQRFIDRPFWHDRGAKTLFGQTGNFNGEDILKQIVAQPQAARFITARLWHFFAGTAPSDELVSSLAGLFRSNGNQFKPVLRAMLASEEFHDPALVRNQVKSPVQWLVGSVRLLERELPPPLVCVALTRNLGQELFAPPNVKGWDGGLSWITTNTLLARYNQAEVLVQGDLEPLRGLAFAKNGAPTPQSEHRLESAQLAPVRVEKLLTESERDNIENLVPALERHLLQAHLKPKPGKALRDYLAAQPKLDNAVLLQAIRLVMSTPEYQLI